jgi:hypothetical protein
MRRRQPLKPDNFPFLAVLLCAMGSLILLLLVMDRRARVVARAKALQAMTRLAEEQNRKQAAEQLVVDQRRADWERRRQQRHTLLEQQEQQVRGQLELVQQRLQAARQRGHEEETHNQDLLQRLGQLQKRLFGSDTALAASQKKMAAANRQVEQSQGELAELTKQLHTLEQLLAATKEARQRELRTHSLVPYHGNRGDSRRPIYVECTAGGVIFHPDKVPLEGTGFEPAAFRSAVEQRVARLASVAPPAPEPTEDKKKATPATYLLFLVRPEGIDNYYRAVHALNGLTFDFGYEFIDSEWVLDFPTEGETPRQQPWMTEQASANPADRSSGAKPPTAGTPRALPQLKEAPRGVALGKGVPDSPGEPGSGLNWASPTEHPASTGTGLGQWGGSSRAPGATPGHAPEPWLPLGSAGAAGGTSREGAVAGSGNGLGGGVAKSSPAGAGVPGGTSGPGTPPRGNKASGSPAGRGASGSVASGASGNGAGQRPQAAGQSGATGGSPETQSAGNRGAGTPPGQSANTTGQSTTGGHLEATAGVGSPEKAGSGSAGGSPSRSEEDAAAGSAPSSRSAALPGGGGSERPDEEPGDPEVPRRLPVGLPNVNPPKSSTTPAPRFPRVVGNRDWIVRVECQSEAVVVYPSSRRFPTTALVPNQPGSKELAGLIQQMIANRQATVREGEPPYRPQVRFLVRPDGVETFFLAYPALEALRVPMNREDLGRDEEVK